MKCKTVIYVATVALALLLRVDAGQIQYGYDENNRLVAVNVNNKTAAQYDYDPAHNLTEHKVVSEPGGLKSFLLYLTEHSGAEKVLRLIGLWEADSGKQS